MEVYLHIYWVVCVCFQTHLTYLLYPVSCFNGQMPLESSLCSIVSSGAEWSTVFLSPLFFITHTCTDTHTHTTPTRPACVLLKLVPARVPGENEMQMVSQLMLSIFGNYVQESKFGLKARFPKHTPAQLQGLSPQRGASKGAEPFCLRFSQSDSRLTPHDLHLEWHCRGSPILLKPVISVPMHSDAFEAFPHLRKDLASLALNGTVGLLSSRHHAVKPNHENLYK